MREFLVRGDGEKRRPRAADGTAERAGVERGFLDVVKMADERRASRLGVTIVEGAAQELAVADAECMREGGGVGHLLDPQRALALIGQQCAGVLGLDADARRDQRDPPIRFHGQLHDIDRIDAARQRQAADDAGGDVVEMSSRDRGFAFERGRDDLADIRRLPECERGRVRAGHARRRAAAHPAGERQPFVQRDDCLISVRTEIRMCGNGRAVAFVVARDELGVAAGDIRHAARAARELDGHAIAGAFEGETEDVEAGTDVADRAGCEGGGGLLHRPFRRRSCRVMATMSLSTPAAVTAAPAPGPVTTSGFVA